MQALFLPWSRLQRPRTRSTLSASAKDQELHGGYGHGCIHHGSQSRLGCLSNRGISFPIRSTLRPDLWVSARTLELNFSDLSSYLPDSISTNSADSFHPPPWRDEYYFLHTSKGLSYKSYR
jgi:hypothetical protein